MHKHNKKVLFIVKQNSTYGFINPHNKSSGLYNSTNSIVKNLKLKGINAELVQVIDNNCIDKEVTKFNPDLVIIEALFVVPSKFKVLKKLHPKVKWFVHLHSEMPFLALEGIAMEWINDYKLQDVGIITNSESSFMALKVIDKDVVYLPNSYYIESLQHAKSYEWQDRVVLNVACLGAIRPFKNHLTQAIAAISLAKKHHKHLYFYVNATRIEIGGAPVLKNLQALFKETNKTYLVEIPWQDPANLTSYLQSEIDIGMQVSMTETFNVVTADYIKAGLPIVVSPEIGWASRFSKANAHNVDEIAEIMEHSLSNMALVKWNQHLLKSFSEKAADMWEYFIKLA